jgi:protein SCO1/2
MPFQTSSNLSRRLLAATFLILPLVVANASDLGQIHGKDITGQGYGGDFQMTDHNGRLRTMADFRGKVLVMFFGYTTCPDFCPTTLAKLASVMKRLGPNASKVQVLFVTIDPERDTEKLLRKYVPAFYPSFIGLRGSEEQTEALAKAFHAQYQILKYGDEYFVDHTASGYLVDPQGQARIQLLYSLSGKEIGDDIQSILAEH